MQKLNIPLGINEKGETFLFDVSTAHHIFITGKTGTGKTTLLYSIISYLLKNYSSNEISLHLVDCKATAFNQYVNSNQISPKQLSFSLLSSLRYLTLEMNKRFNLFSKNGATNIGEFNATAKTKLSRIIVFVDEIGAVNKQDEPFIKLFLSRLTAKAHGAGIHLIINSQRLIPNVFSPKTYANIPTRITFRVQNAKDSILSTDQSGAENLDTGNFLFSDLAVNKPIKLKITNNY